MPGKQSADEELQRPCEQNTTRSPTNSITHPPTHPPSFQRVEPFYGANDQDLIIANKDAVCEFHVPEWDDVSDDAKDFVRRMLDPNPNTRLSPARALKHPWLTRAMAAAQWSDTPTGGLAAGRLPSLPGVKVIYDSDDDIEGPPEVDRSWMEQRQEQAGSTPPTGGGTGCVVC